MTLLKLYTNEYPDGLFLHPNTSKKLLQKRMYEYTKHKLSKGYPLRMIVFCWSEFQTQSIPEIK